MCLIQMPEEPESRCQQPVDGCRPPKSYAPKSCYLMPMPSSFCRVSAVRSRLCPLLATVALVVASQAPTSVARADVPTRLSSDTDTVVTETSESIPEESTRVAFDPREGRARRLGLTWAGTMGGLVVAGAATAAWTGIAYASICGGEGFQCREAMYVVASVFGATNVPLAGFGSAFAARRADSLAPRWVFGVGTLMTTLHAVLGGLAIARLSQHSNLSEGGELALHVVSGFTATLWPSLLAEISHTRRARRGQSNRAQLELNGVGCRLRF